jgi:amino acid adenylation domain-containing protein
MPSSSSPIEPDDLVELLQTRAAEKGDALAFRFLLDGEEGETDVGYGELDARARDVGARLQEQGAAGERVLLLYPPGIEYITGFLGCLYAGAVAVPAYPPRPDRPLGRFLSILEDATPKFALATEAIVSVGAALLPQSGMRWMATDRLDGAAAASWKRPATGPGSLAFLQYTSGSTASPKGVMVTHGNLLDNEARIRRSFGTEGTSKVAGWLPLYHDMGLIGNVLHPLYLGTSCVLMSPLEFLRNPFRWLQMIHASEATVSGGPNFAYDLCVRKTTPAQRATLDLHRWKVAFNGAEPIRPETLDRFCEAFRETGFRREAFVPCYGLAEATLLVTGGRPRVPTRSFVVGDLERGRAVESIEDRSGLRPLPSCGEVQSLRIVDAESKAELPEGRIGEIWVHSPSVASGYWGKEEATATTFGARITSGEGPFLRTGDLGFVAHGDLFVVGRIKDLIIIRGRNHAPQDIERTAEQSHPAIRPGCSAAFSIDVDGEERLAIVHEVVDPAASATGDVMEAVRRAVASEHEVQVHAVVLIPPRAIPKTSSGKIQRRACREAFLSSGLEVVASWRAGDADTVSAPAGPSEAASPETWLAARVARCAGMDVRRVDLDAPVSRHGLDSLQTVELAHEIEERFAVRVAMDALFGDQSLRELAARIGATGQRVESVAAPEPIEGDAPLSDGQRALWLLHQLAPASAVYNVPSALRLLGPLDVVALRRAIESLVQRHAILRTTFPAVDGEPVQRVLATPEVPLVLEPAAAGEATLRDRLLDEAARPFRVDRDLPLRARLFVVSPAEHVLLVTMHHLVTDFWSQAIVLRELATLYAAEKSGAPAELPPVRETFQGHARRQAEMLSRPDGERMARYWMDRLAGVLPVLSLPTSRRRPPVQSFDGACETLTLGADLTASIRQLARRQGATPFAVLLSAFQALLHRYTGQDDIVVGTAVAGRTEAATASTPGYFVNPVALRARPRPELPFDALLAQTRSDVRGALEHQEYPFARLVQRLRPARDPSRSPVFQAMFTLQQGHGTDTAKLTAFAMNVAGSRLPWADLTIESVPLEQHIAQFDLSLTVGEVEGRLHATFDYCTALFDADFVRTMARSFEELLRGAVATPSCPLGELPLLSDREREAHLSRWNDTRKAFPEDETIHAWIERQARRTPDAVALVSGGVPTSYAELLRRSGELAERLRREGVAAESVVGIYLERGAGLVTAMLATLRAGAAFLPLDPQYPAERLAAMLRDSRVRLVLTQTSLASTLPPEVRALPLDALSLDAGSTTAPPVSVASRNLACVIYTSGSTGAPRGVMLEHRALVNLVASFHESYLPTTGDRILPVTSSGSVSFVGEVLPLLCAGGAVVIPSQEEMLDEERLQALVRDRGVTILSTLPSRLATLRSTRLGASGVRLVLSGGEALSAADLANVGGGLKLVNGYGLTETAACSTYHEVSPEDLSAGRTIPIGGPIRNTRLYVLDASLQCVPTGCAGELFIAGDGVARGYERLPAATAERFVPDPFFPGERMYHTGDEVRRRADGELEFLGRADQQVKIRGHRIELEEITAALRAHDAVEDALVVARGAAAADRHLVAYVVPAKGAEAPSPSVLSAFLRERLPAPMVPAAFVELASLPLSPNGKIDRSALPEPGARRPELASSYRSPRGELERVIADVWKEALRVEHVGLDDNFFDLGGHSLLLARVHATLKERLQRELTLVDLFRFPTVGSLATHLSPGGHADPCLAPAPRMDARATDRSIAIIGMAGRFPGAKTPDGLWDNLVRGVESISFFSDEELIAAGADPALVRDPNYVKASGIIGDVDRFDASFFGLSPREAELMDPQHRIFLECAWEAVESAGYDSSRYGRRVGVFGGSSMNTYMLMNLLSHMKLVASLDTLQASLGNDKDTMTSRVSYKLDLKGPSVTIQSASSTSLVAVHVACQSLLSGDCDMALAGGVSIHLPEKSGYMYHEGGTSAVDGHCRAFDAAATGFVSGKGAGVVLLKRLADAIADGDHIHAVIRGSACNNDGALKVSYTAPSVAGQVDVYQQALSAARVTPRDVGYIECHGTGTAMGDPIEIAALAQAYGGEGAAPGSCAIGSLKTNIGHLDTAAGVCGLIKAALCVEHAQLVPTLHFTRPNPEIDFESTPFEVNTTLRGWSKSPRIAGVTSLGMGGTNAHVILAEAPPAATSGASRREQLLVLSASTPGALETACRNLGDHLESNLDVALADAAFVLRAGRRALKHRRAVVCSTRDEAIASLRSGGASPALGGTSGGTPSVAFLFPGQGAQYVDMGRALYEEEAVFRGEVDRACDLLLPVLGFDLRHRLYPEPGFDGPEAAEALRQTATTQPALFVVEYALAKLLMSWGVEPQAMLGHSVGEYVAACLAGVFSLNDALGLVAARGRLMQQMDAGSMMAIDAPADRVAALLPPELCVAAVNEPGSCVVAGPTEAVRPLQLRLAAQGLTGQLLHTSHAFHSAAMDPVLAPFLSAVAKVELSAPSIPFLSNVTGTWITDAQATDPRYWVSQLRQAVQFAPAIGELLRTSSRVCVEVGPGHALSSFVRGHASRKLTHDVVPTMRHPKEAIDDQRFLLRAVGKLWTRGVTLDDEGFFAGEQRRRVRLPTYPFERQRHWVDPKPAPARGSGEVADVRQLQDEWFYSPVWKLAPRTGRAPFPQGEGSTWVVTAEGRLGQAMVESLRTAGEDVIMLTPGPQFARVAQDEARLAPSSAEAFREALQSLPTPRRVILVGAGSCTAEAALDSSFFSPAAFAQAWGAHSAPRPVELVLVSSGARDVTGTENLDPVQAAALGAVRVIPLEYQAVRCRSIDLGAQASDGATASVLVAEILGGSEVEVALRGRRRWVPSYERVALDPPATSLRDGGVYVVTGGLGGIGLAVAESIARTVRARIVLLARSPLPPRSEWPVCAKRPDPVGERVRRIVAMEQEHGAEVEVLACDVGDADALRAAIGSTKVRFGAIHGVIHAAGTPGGRLVQLQDRGSAEAVFTGKLRGALALRTALENEPVDFVVLCSSLTAVVAMPGQMAYVAANAVLDAVAQEQAARGGPWVAIDWDAWRETGMASRAESPSEVAAVRNAMLRDGLSTEEGLGCLWRILGSGLSQVVVSTHPLAARLGADRALGGATTRPDTAKLSSGDEGSTSRPSPTSTIADDLEKRVAAVWREMLGLEEIGDNDNFFDLGGTSLIGIKIVGRLRSELGIDISAVGLFQAPTLRSLTTLIRDSQGAAAAPDVAQSRGARRRIQRARG